MGLVIKLSLLALVCALAAGQNIPDRGFEVGPDGRMISSYNQNSAGSPGAPCEGNCLGNKNGNNNGNNNINSDENGNNNGNCRGNCLGTVNGNGNGNDNVDSNNNGNANGNCLGNCYHTYLGNGNGNRNTGADNNGNLNGNCRGNCFHYNNGNNNGNDNGQLLRGAPQQDGDCVGNCYPEFPTVPEVSRSANYNYKGTALSCSIAGYTYYVAEGSYCTEVNREGHGTAEPFRCNAELVFDLDTCGCDRWWFVDIYKTCRSGFGQWEASN
jgi:hypothetical protein